MKYYFFQIVDNFGGVSKGITRASSIKGAEQNARAHADYMASLHRLPKSFYEVKDVKNA